MPTQGIVSVRTEFVNNRGSMKASLSIFKNVQNDVTCIQPLKNIGIRYPASVLGPIITVTFIFYIFDMFDLS